MIETRRDFLKLAAAATVASVLGQRQAFAQSSASIESGDRVYITNEDSNTITVIDPRSNTVETTINLTSFDEDARPPFRLVTAGVMPTHAAMIHKPLYHGCIDAHGAVPSPDGRFLATSGRGSSNVYLIDAVNKKVVGNTANPLAGPSTNNDRISSGILVGREPHEPTFTRNGKELWVTLRGEDRIAILDVERAMRQAGGVESGAILRYINTINGPAQVWFDANHGKSLLAQRRNQMLLLVVVQVLFSMAVLAMVLVSRVLRPIERLKDQATALVPDLGGKATMSWRRQDELGQLGRHLGKVQRQLATLFGELEQKNQQLQALALYDQLTGLPNRSLFHDLVQRELLLARRRQQRFGLLFVDLDRFKAVNDSMGHGAGDAVLVQVSQRLRSVLREVDVVCRQSGDEFLLMVRDIDHWERLGEVAERLLQAVETPVRLPDAPGNPSAQVSASVGIAVYPDDAEDFETLVKHADIAMYQAKALGRARYSFFHIELNQRLQAHLELEQALGAAIANHELVLHYQPQVDARSGQLIGVEALVRWQHPTRGLLYPGAFIGIAEECGKIADMGAWTLAAACDQMAQWARRGIEVGRMSVQ